MLIIDDTDIVTSRLFQESENGLCLLSPHIEEFWKNGDLHYLVLHATSMNKFYLTVYYF